MFLLEPCKFSLQVQGIPVEAKQAIQILNLQGFKFLQGKMQTSKYNFQKYFFWKKSV